MVNPLDMNKDGTVTDDEIAAEKAEREIRNSDKREAQQRRMAWIAMWSMIAFTGVLFTPLVSVDRVNALSSLFSMFYVAQAGVVATFFGAQAYLNR